MGYRNAFHEQLDAAIRVHSGLHNAHAHVDRFGTAQRRFYGSAADHKRIETIHLWEKQASTTLLHSGIAYTEDSLRERISRFLEESANLGVARLDSFIDVTSQIPLSRGLGALRVALELKERFRGRIDFHVGAYAPFGFKDGDDAEWSLYREAAEMADFLASLPERDDPHYYGATGDRIGLERHFRQTIGLALELRKPIHFHLDQQLSPHEFGTEALVDAIEGSALGHDLALMRREEPLVWAVHTISPAAYDADRLARLLDRMAAHNIGVICCPSAALSMRKIRSLIAPLNKGLAEVLEMLDRGMWVRLGTDNVDDVFLPATTLDLRDEVGCLANALRFYRVEVLAKLACGKQPDPNDLALVREHLDEEKREESLFLERSLRAGRHRTRETF